MAPRRMPCNFCNDDIKKILVMMVKICVELALVGAIASVFLVAAHGTREERAREQAAAGEYMRHLDRLTGLDNNRLQISNWNYDSNMTEYNLQVMMTASLEIAEQKKEQWKETVTYDWNEFDDTQLRRKFIKYSKLGTAALPEDLNERLIQAVSSMKNNYATATICDFNEPSKCDLTIEPGVTDIFATSQNAEELKSAWVQWHRAAGTVSKGNFTEYVNLNNEAAKLNGYENTAEWWLSEYEATDTEKQFVKLWQKIRPLYLQIHAYVRRHLRLKYGEEVVSARGPIPAHLLGNIWAQTWTNLEKFTRPYPDKPEVDVTSALVSQNFTALKMFQMSDEFFRSINLTAMPEKFWENSIIEKPTDGRDMVCHASAWDFFDGEDFRIKQCTTITSSFFKTTHHEMGHIQYYLQYKDQPQIFRAGANPGFHEAVGDVIALSVSTPKHLRVVGLLEEGPDDTETEINQLYSMGLDKIVFLPFGYLLDLFRYGVFRETTSADEYNCHFWAFREALQGVEPPVARTEEDFDAAAKYHVTADVEYARYYVSYIVQFQFHRALCQLAGEFGGEADASARLSACDIYRSTEAGNALGKMLRMGASKPWPDAMEALTGQRKMSADGVLEYFQPLQQWLQAENEKNGEYIGWEPSTVQYCTEKQQKKNEKSGFNANLKQFSGK